MCDNPLWFNKFLPLRSGAFLSPCPPNNFLSLSGLIYANPLWLNNILPLRGRIGVGVLRRSRFSGDGRFLECGASAPL